jgi:hypothetical protein
MCNVLLKDPNNNFWQLASDDFGIMETTLTPITVQTYAPPVIKAGGNAWTLSADITGQVALNPTNITKVALPYIILHSTSKQWQLTFSPLTQQLLMQPTSIGQQDVIPTETDVSMSRWPEGYNGLLCPNCANASVTVSGDLSCWCCVCSSFVLPENTTIEVALSE